MATVERITEKNLNYNELLNQAISEQGTISKCYSLFHNYSIQNQILAMYQMKLRGMNITPINSMAGWNRLGRRIKKGSTAISLWMPIGGYKVKVKDENGNEVEKYIGTRFAFKNNWFSLEQTQGDEFKQEDIKVQFNFDKVYSHYNIKLVKFEMLNGNVQGYANTIKKELAINPLAEHPEMTILHEIAHIALKHNEGNIEKHTKEVEAESVAYIVGSIIGVSENELSNSRGYIQNWLSNNKLTDKTTNRIFKVANDIIKYGKV